MDECETSCGLDKDSENQEKIDEFVKEFHEHGIGCGLDISKLAKEIHPNAIAIVPLYRSCIVIEQNDEDKKEGIATMHTYADPHWMGGEITIDALQSEDFHSIFNIQGLREGPEIVLINANSYQKMLDKSREKVG